LGKAENGGEENKKEGMRGDEEGDAPHDMLLRCIRSLALHHSLALSEGLGARAAVAAHSLIEVFPHLVAKNVLVRQANICVWEGQRTIVRGERRGRGRTTHRAHRWPC
jgi:hypothetical protein